MKTLVRYLMPSIFLLLSLLSLPGQAQVGGLKKNYVAAWGGINGYGQLNVSSDVANSYIVDIAVGHTHVLALLADRMTIKGWGSNAFGESSTQNFGKAVVDLSAGEGYSMALLVDGTVQFWGFPSSIPAMPYTGVVPEPGAIEAGNTHWLVKTSEETLYDSRFGTMTFPLPIVDMEAGYEYSLALLADGSLYQWGPDLSAPNLTRVLIGVRAEKGAIAAGDTHWLALMNNPTANVVYEGSLMAGEFTGFRPPFHKQIKELGAGRKISLALFRDGTFTGWGEFYTQPGSWLNGGWFLNGAQPSWLNKATVLEVGAGTDFSVAFYSINVPIHAPMGYFMQPPGDR